MSAINNVLKYSTWQENKYHAVQEPYDLRQLEADILPNVLDGLFYEQTNGLSIEFCFDIEGLEAKYDCLNSQDRQAHDTTVAMTSNLKLHNSTAPRLDFVTNAPLLQECLSAVLLNAIQACSTCEAGIVKLIMRRKDSSLSFRVVDNGVGIESMHHAIINQPYEKVDTNIAGAGLGLTMASELAKESGGSVDLIWSTLGQGSEFRLRFDNSSFDEHSMQPSRHKSLSLERIPREFQISKVGSNRVRFLDHTMGFLHANGFVRSDNPDVGPVFTNGQDSDCQQIHSEFPKAIIIQYCSQSSFPSNIHSNPAKESGLHYVIHVSGYLTNLKLEQILKEAEILYTKLSEQMPKYDGKARSIDSLSPKLLVLLP